MFFNIGFWEVIVVLIVALLVTKPDKLPFYAHIAGRFFKRIINTVKSVQQEWETWKK